MSGAADVTHRLSLSWKKKKDISLQKGRLLLLQLYGEEVHVVADGLLHGAFEGLVGGFDR